MCWLLNSSVVALAVIRGGRIVLANSAFLAAFRATTLLAGVPLADIVIDSDGDRLVEYLLLRTLRRPATSAPAGAATICHSTWN